MPSLPLRIGFGWGGGDMKELGVGFGMKKSVVMFDFGFAFRNGMWLHTMKGLNLSLDLLMLGTKTKRRFLMKKVHHQKYNSTMFVISKIIQYR